MHLTLTHQTGGRSKCTCSDLDDSVKCGIHSLVWRTEIFGLTHHLCKSNRAEGAKPQRETVTEDGPVRHHYGAYGEKQRAGVLESLFYYN